MLKAFALALFLSPLCAAAQSISFTFDDGLDPRAQPRAGEWNEQILMALDRGNVKAMVFPAGRIADSPEGVALVARWSERGHAIGNHTYAHRSLGSQAMDLDTFTQDVLRADQMFSHLPGWTRRLRFPYLKEGDTRAKRDGMRDWMARQGYAPAPVSVDTSDWYYDLRFAVWRGAHEEEDLAGFEEAYVKHLLDRAVYYDRLAQQLLGRRPAHVVLLHVNRLNAAFLPAVLARFRKEGWTFVSPLEAFADPLYSQAPATLPAGESIVWALARQAGHPGLRYPAENDVYEKPALDARGL
jgi:peptidoglycan-N-acetylglucosamine deacetylase